MTDLTKCLGQVALFGFFIWLAVMLADAALTSGAGVGLAAFLASCSAGCVLLALGALDFGD